MNFDVMWSSFPKLIQGIPTTLFLVSTSLAIGFVFAVVFAQMRLSKNAMTLQTATSADIFHIRILLKKIREWALRYPLYMPISTAGRKVFSTIKNKNHDKNYPRTAETN